MSFVYPPTSQVSRRDSSPGARRGQAVAVFAPRSTPYFPNCILKSTGCGSGFGLTPAGCEVLFSATHIPHIASALIALRGQMPGERLHPWLLA